MKRLILSTVILTLSLFPTAVEAQTVIDFEELSFDASLPDVLLGGGDVFNGYAQGAPTGAFSSNGVSFETQEFGPGFSYSRFQNSTTPGFTNLFAAFPGGGSGGNGTTVPGQTYGLVATGASTTSTGVPTSSATVTFSGSVDLNSIDVANSTFAALYFRDGLDGFDPEPDSAQQFADDGDFLTLLISGFDLAGAATGSTTVDLARFENGSLEFVQDWETVDLTGFSSTSSLTFSLSSNDFNEFGLLVPTFFAIDNLEFQSVPVAVPEPSSLAILGLGGLTVLLRRRKS